MVDMISRYNQAPQKIKSVYLFNDSGGEVTVSQGEGLVYYTGYTGGLMMPEAEDQDDPCDSADEACPLRGNIVVEKIVAGTEDNNCFAGVALEDVTVGDDEGKWIKIAEPGSICKVLVSANISSLPQLLQCEGADADGDIGEWTTASSVQGRGVANALQTGDGSSTSTLILAKLQDGGESGLADNS